MRNTRPYILIAIAWSALVGAQQVTILISTSYLEGSALEMTGVEATICTPVTGIITPAC